MYRSVRLKHPGFAPAAALFAALAAVALLFAFAFAGVGASVAYAASAADGAGLASADSAALGQSTLTAQAEEDGWVFKDDGYWYYYRNGKKLTGLHKIDGRRYIFKSNGRLHNKDFERNGVTYYLRHGQLSIMGFKMYGQYYYSTMKPMSEADAYDFDTLIWARSINESLSKEDDSDSTKLWNAFKWVVDQGYAIHQNFNPYEENWVAKYARYHFNGDGGDCHSDAAAFAYLAAEIGYDADACIDSWATGYAPSHSWGMIGDAVYDPLFYEAKSTMYYGATSGTYETNPTARFHVPTFSSKNAAKDAEVAKELLESSYEGLTKLNGNYYFFKSGEPLKSKWKVVDGKRYYFKKDGAAAKSGSMKIKGKYYVFNKKGQLQKSSGKYRIVKIAGTYYRVNKKGQAAKGLSPNKKSYYLKDGRRVVGLQVYSGKFYAANDKGVYNVKKTNTLRKASKANARAADLYQLLGEPKEIYYSSNCEGKGYDGLWVYDNFIVTTIKPKNAHKAAYDAKLLAKGKKVSKPYEYVVSIEAS